VVTSTVLARPKGVKVVFTHDTDLALAAAAGLVNTLPSAVGAREEELRTTADLDVFTERWRWSGDRTHDQAELAAVRALRPRLAQFWHLDVDGVVELANTLLREAKAMPQLVRHDGFDYHIHATSPHAPLAERMAVEAAMAMVDVVRAGELERLRICAADDCDDVYVDLSKNRSRRFCGVACSNRTNVAAYRARQRGTGLP
jgi:predicted RNA-binding Zn ribbon-like protein